MKALVILTGLVSITSAGLSADYVTPAAGWDDLPPVKASADDWPWWRGPGLNNIAAPGQKPPIEWSETKNILWKIPIPGRGHATPCVVGDRIFVPTGDASADTISMLCFDRDTGRERWKQVLFEGTLPKIHGDNSHASATPAFDGERLFFPYQTVDSIRMCALTPDGKIAWDEQVAPYTSVQGYSASPALYKSAVIVPADGKPTTPNYLTALHRKTGKIVWRSPRPRDNENYASPLVARVGGRDQLFIIGTCKSNKVGKTISYDPNNGRKLWETAGPATYAAATVAFSGNMVYATGGYPQKSLVAITVAGRGRVAWRSDKRAGYVPSPVISDGLLYAVSDKTGLMRCYDAAKGTVIWEQELAAPFYSSPVLSGDMMYVFDRKGGGYVMRAGRKFSLLAKNELPEGAFATPVILKNRIYLRTMKTLYCIGLRW